MGMSSAGVTQPEPWGLGIFQDLFYFRAVQHFSILAPGGRAAGSAPHIHQSPIPCPGQAGVWLQDFWDLFLQSQAGGAAQDSHRDGAGSPGKCRDGGEKQEKKKKSANEMNQLLQGRQPELSPILLFPRRKAGKGGGRISFPEHSAG